MNLLKNTKKNIQLIGIMGIFILITCLNVNNLYSHILFKSIPIISTDSVNEFKTTKKLISLLTQIEVDSQRSVLFKAVPLIKHTNLNNNYNESKYILGLSKFSSFTNKDKDDDYFDKKSEIKIKDTQISDEEDMFTDYQSIDDSYILQKLINFEKNLNNDNQALGNLDIEQLLNKPFDFTNISTAPKVLIIHTHSMEKFKDEDKDGEGVLGLGNHLKEILEKQYNIPTMQCRERFDVVDAKLNINGSYGRMEPRIQQILKENPTVELVMDIHRDGIDEDTRLITNVNGKPTAKVMFVNGLCKIQKDDILTPIQSLPSKYVEDNLALSLQLQLKANEDYPGFMRKILVKPYRYSLHMRPKSLLIEVGAQNNTKQEAFNAMEPLAEILMSVIKKD